MSMSVPHFRLSNLLNTFVFFFFSSRRRHTRFDCDWSSDVCSSDLRYSHLSAPPTVRVGLSNSCAKWDSCQEGRHASCQHSCKKDEADERTCGRRSEEHTSELQSQSNLVCRLLLEKKNKYQ